MTPEAFASVARCIDTPLLLTTSDGRILAVNAASVREFQRPVNALVDASLAELLDDSAESVRVFLRASSRTRETTPARFGLVREGEHVEFLFEGHLAEPRRGDQRAILIVALRARADANRSFVALNQKIAELTSEIGRRKRLEEERSVLLAAEKAARLEAERASRAKDDFLAVVSHELRAPMNVLKGWIELLAEGDVEPHELQATYETLQRNCTLQVHLIEDLLDMSRIVSGKLKLELAPIELAPVIEAARESVAPAAAAKGVELFSTSSAAIGPVAADAARMQQVITNLLSNAIRHSKPGGRVFVSVRKLGPKVEIKVTDEGEGIASDFIPFVFDRFRQEDGSKRRAHGGLGLGLSIVKHLVEQHRGTVAAASAGKGRGAEFTVTLPLPSEPGDSDTTPSAEPEPTYVGLLAGLRILVVDDEADARFLVARILKKHGAEVVMASNAKEAFQSFTAERFDILMSDIGMPGETGYDLIRKIRHLDPESGGRTPAAAITGFASASDRAHALAEGFHEHLTKPVQPQRLLEVTSMLGRRLGFS